MKNFYAALISFSLQAITLSRFFWVNLPNNHHSAVSHSQQLSNNDLSNIHYFKDISPEKKQRKKGLHYHTFFITIDYNV